MIALRPRRESPDKDAAGAAGNDAETTPMERFKALARGLLNVPREDVMREEHYKAANAARKRKNGKRLTNNK